MPPRLAVSESSITEPGAQCHRLWTWPQCQCHRQSTKTEPGATRGNESCWKPQNLVLSVTDCRIGLTSMPQTMTYKTGQAQDEATRVVPGTTKDTTCWDDAVHARSSTNANQTENEAGRSVCQCCRPPTPSPTPSRLDSIKWKTRKAADWDRASLWWSHGGVSAASTPANRARANQGMENYPNPFRRL